MTALDYAPVCRCGKPLKVFVSSGRIAKSCSKECTSVRIRRESGQQPKRERVVRVCSQCGQPVSKGSTRCRACYDSARCTRRECICKGCGNTFIPKETRAATFCSKKCARRHQRRERKNPGPYRKVWFRDCAVCGVPFVAHRSNTSLCSAECKRWRAPPMARACKWCGDNYQPGSGGGRQSPYCGAACAKASSAEQARRYRGNYRRENGNTNSRKKARLLGVAYEPIKAGRVFERDGWRCQICGKDTPKGRRGTRYSNAPELDHRVPMSKGGPHTYSNVQCACRACNGRKSNRSSVGQLPMFAP